MSSHAIYGLLGYPVKHSLSPAMHNAAFKALGIDAEYRLFEIKPADVAGFFLGAADTLAGFNVTVPHKERVAGLVTLAPGSEYLAKVGAVNTVVKREGRWCAYNTDIPGFQRHLTEQFDPAGKRAAVLGAGGASRAVCYALAASGAREISIYDIDGGKMRAIISMLQALFPAFPVRAASCVADIDIRAKDILINATPVGMKPADPCIIGKDLLHKDLFVYDLIYNPAQTKLLALAQNAGCRISNGLGMLLYQGALAFEHFTGRDAPVEVMRGALEEGIRKLC